MYPNNDLAHIIAQDVEKALAEDIGSGDITAQLVDPNARTLARAISRDHAIICGEPWVNQVFKQIDNKCEVHWSVSEGSSVHPDQTVFTVEGKARSILTAERCALNFLQFLSGIATRCRYFANMVSDTDVRLLDTRKTIPGMRSAQKYAVKQGGCYNHRAGLYDAFLIKENHIASHDSIKKVIASARTQAPGKLIEIEVESLEQLQQALDAKADVIMLDNFSHEEMQQAVAITDGKAKLEASGNINEETLKSVAQTGVDFISMGTLTKDIRAIDFSMRIVEQKH